ncbi:ATPase PAAT-like [Ptychodera flava]|uniref:ATPase PAAT-like n=1 Tax=Ptychodera flava TaxID=63121 RepID=UPI00396A91C0
MERLQNCWASISWKEDSAGIDINSILQRDIQDTCDQTEDLFTIATRGVNLSAPDAEKLEPCILQLSCQQNFHIITVSTVSDAKHTEVYNNNNEYSGTVRGQSFTSDNDDPNRADVLYRGEWTFEKPVNQCAVKFLSLKDKCRMKLYHIKVVLEQLKEQEAKRGVGILPSQPTVDMSQVRLLLGSMNQDTDEKTQQLMSSIEEYQKNKSAMYEDIQGLMQGSVASQSTKESSNAASSALGMLSMFSKLSALQGKQTPTMNMPAPMAMPETNSDSDNRAAMFSMMKNICGEVTRMRADIREEEMRKEEEGNEKNKESLNVERTVRDNNMPDERTEDWLSQMEDRAYLMQRIDEAEKRIMDRVESGLAALQSHFDERLDALLLMLTQKFNTNSAELPVD